MTPTVTLTRSEALRWIELSLPSLTPEQLAAVLNALFATLTLTTYAVTDKHHQPEPEQ